jgi:hypothetical protein
MIMPEHTPSPFTSASVTRHLARGFIGFSLIGAAFALAASGTPIALALVAPGALALRGCPTCWLVGLAQTISAGRLERSCHTEQSARFEQQCSLQRSRSSSTTT